MNKERSKELLPIIEAFVNGKVIEYLFVGEWRVATCPDWTPGVKYRIKQEPKLVPFTLEDKELLVNKWVVEKGYTAIDKIIRIANDGVLAGNKAITYSKLFHSYEFSDGYPCGKYINE